MKLTCIHGYFIAREDVPGEIARFNSLFSQDFVSKDDYYTFELLADAPDFSIVGLAYLNLVGLVNYAAKPFEVMEQNGFIYDFSNKVLKPIEAIAIQITPIRLNEAYSTRGLIQPGSLTKDWERVKGYNCDINMTNLTFIYSGIIYA